MPKKNIFFNLYLHFLLAHSGPQNVYRYFIFVFMMTILYYLFFVIIFNICYGLSIFRIDNVGGLKDTPSGGVSSK